MADQYALADTLAELRQALEELEAIPADELDAPTLELRRATRVLLERYDHDQAGDR